jgi:hypothetical protein
VTRITAHLLVTTTPKRLASKLVTSAVVSPLAEDFGPSLPLQSGDVNDTTRAAHSGGTLLLGRLRDIANPDWKMVQSSRGSYHWRPRIASYRRVRFSLPACYLLWC